MLENEEAILVSERQSTTSRKNSSCGLKTGRRAPSWPHFLRSKKHSFNGCWHQAGATLDFQEIFIPHSTSEGCQVTSRHRKPITKLLKHWRTRSMKRNWDSIHQLLGKPLGLLWPQLSWLKSTGYIWQFWKCPNWIWEVEVRAFKILGILSGCSPVLSHCEIHF